MNKSTATKEPGLPTRMQAEVDLPPCSCGTEHCTRAPSWAAGLSQSTLPLAPDTAATKVQGEEKPGRERPNSVGHVSPSSPHPAPGPSPHCWPRRDPTAGPTGSGAARGPGCWDTLSVSRPPGKEGQRFSFPKFHQPLPPKTAEGEDPSTHRKFLLFQEKAKLPSSVQDRLKLLLPLVFL